MTRLSTVKAVCVSLFLVLTPHSVAKAIDALNVTDLPQGGDVTVPGDYPIYVPNATEVQFSGLSTPQAITFTNFQGTSVSIIRIYANHEQHVRTLALQPGMSAVYNFKNIHPVRVKVVSGDVRIRSMLPLKIQR